MEEHLIDNELNPSPKDILHGILRWWEKKRLLFNAIIIGIALLAFVQALLTGTVHNQLGLSFVIQSIVYLLFINGCYCVGWGLQSLGYYYFNIHSDSNVLEYVLFVSGTLFTGLITYFGFLQYLRYW